MMQAESFKISNEQVLNVFELISKLFKDLRELSSQGVYVQNIHNTLSDIFYIICDVEFQIIK